MRTEYVPVGTIEQLDATVTAGAVISGTVTICLVDANGAEGTYAASTWVGSETDPTTGVVRNRARTTAAQTLNTVGTFTVRVKFVNGGETVKRDCYILKVTP